MFSTAEYTLLAFILTSVSTLAFLIRKMFGGHDPREPPIASPSIPIIGHMVGLARSKFNYYVDLSKQTDAPIFTMSLPGQNKIYVVTKPELVQAVQKQPRLLAFPPIEAKFASSICGVSSKAQAILANNVNGDEGHTGLSMESYDGMRFALKPGPALDDMSRVMLQEIVKSLDDLQPLGKSGEASRTIGIYSWLREALHPPRPAGGYSSVRGWRLGGHHGKHGTCCILDSVLFVRRPRPSFRHSCRGRGVYRDRNWHQSCQDDQHFHPQEAVSSTFSSYQETLRHRSMGTSVREVMQDTMLDGRWLLKKGAMLQMPSRIIHQDSGLWGSDVADYNPRRFLPEERKNRPSNICFRAFGGGETLCPGRHFATNEALAVVALFVVRFDMVPVTADGICLLEPTPTLPPSS
ncbi:hypothetical protein V8F06_014220 [Rhypophila decipiens]